MSAGDAIQAAIAGSLDSVAELSGVFDGPPARAAFPYVTIDAAMETDWSHKNGQGREVMIGLTVWDDQPVRLRTLAKGQPDTVYSYSVSFAVALSSRPVRAIGRIWADGKLIRDADGVFKVPTTFRFHAGGEGQELDPLIASIEGIETTPAYRGLALAVFETMELAEFGNRIPFITAEVIGDDLPPTIGAIVNDASDRRVTCEDTRTVGGYAAHGRTVRSAIEPLVDMLAVRLVDNGTQVRTPPDDIIAVGVQDEIGASADEPGSRYRREQAAAGEVPTSVRLSYYDPARDYQFGEARASNGGVGRIELQRDVPAVIDAESAKALANEQLARAWAERERLTVRLPTRHLAVQPGACVTLPLNPERWLVERTAIEGFCCVLELRPFWTAPAPQMPADSGRLFERAPEVGEMNVALFEAPATGDGSSEPTLLLAASSNGPGWRTAAVEVSVGGHRFAERTARRKSVLGRTISELGADARTVEVQLIDRDQWLLSCDAERVEQGCNLAMLGGEVIQFRDAEAIGPGRFRLSGLRRGIGRPKRSSCTHRPGQLFLLLERDGVKPIDLPPWADMAEVAAETRCGSRAVLQRKSFQSRSKLTERIDSSIA